MHFALSENRVLAWSRHTGMVTGAYSRPRGEPDGGHGYHVLPNVVRVETVTNKKVPFQSSHEKQLAGVQNRSGDLTANSKDHIV